MTQPKIQRVWLIRFGSDPNTKIIQPKLIGLVWVNYTPISSTLFLPFSLLSCFSFHNLRDLNSSNIFYKGSLRVEPTPLTLDEEWRLMLVPMLCFFLVWGLKESLWSILCWNRYRFCILVCYKHKNMKRDLKEVCLIMKTTEHSLLNKNRYYPFLNKITIPFEANEFILKISVNFI